MATFATFVGRNRDLLYLLVIACLSAWILKFSSPGLSEQGNDILTRASQTIQDLNKEGQLEQIRENNKGYPCRETDVYKNRAEQIFNICQNLKGKSLSEDSIKTLLVLLGKLCDNDAPTVQQLSDCWAKADIAGLAEQQLRIDLTCAAALSYCRIKTSPKIVCRFDHFTPVVIPQTYGIKPGELFKADVMLMRYASGPDSLEIKVNGLPIQQKNGMGAYSCTFVAPGEQRLQVEILMYNPDSQQFESYKKDVAVVIPE